MQLLIAKTRTRNRAARQQSLLTAASKLFAARGFEVTTTRQIAAEAGCAEGLIHRYFGGKAGLLLAIIEARASQENIDRDVEVSSAANFEEEVMQLVTWEVDRMWDDREFLKVVIPRALVDAALAEMIQQASVSTRVHAIVNRLQAWAECRALPREELDALASFIATTGFMFGFMRTAVLGQDRAQARATASILAKMMCRSFASRLPAHPTYVDQRAAG